MTNREKLQEVFPRTIFIYRKENDKTNAIICTDEWLDSEYIEPQKSEGRGMTRADKFKEIFGYRPATDQVLCNEHDYCGESDACNYCMSNPNNIGREEDWWNAGYESESEGRNEIHSNNKH